MNPSDEIEIVVWNPQTGTRPAAHVLTVTGNASSDAQGLSGATTTGIENLRQKVPAFAIRTVQGDDLSTEELAGKVVLLDFWATWCAPHRAAGTDLRNPHQEFAENPRFLLISMDAEKDDGKWQEFVRTQHMTWPQSHDEGARRHCEFKVTALPTYVLIGADGTLRWRFGGWSRESHRRIADEIYRSVQTLQRQ